MITISMDEGGTFERQTRDLCLVAGVVFDDKGKKDEADREKSRIKKFFSGICQTAGVTYPVDLHYSSGLNNGSRVGKAKELYRQKLGEFLSSGACDGKELLSDDGKAREGTYYVYAVVKSREGKQLSTGKHLSNLVNDNAMSNLYMHMTEDALSRVLFYNDLTEHKKEVSLDLAKRMFRGNDTEIYPYEKVAFQRHEKHKDGIPLVSGDFFRTSLEREMAGVPNKQKHITKLLVRSAYYGEDAKNQEYLYLADAVCTAIGHGVTYASKPSYVDVVWERMEALCEKHSLLFLYDDADTMFTKAWDALERGELFQCLTNLYDAVHGENEASSFYKRNWEGVLRKRMKKKTDAPAYMTAVQTFVRTTRSDHRDEQRNQYIYKRLEELGKGIVFQNAQESAVMYDLYDAGVSVYNHAGQHKKAEHCRRMSDRYYKYVGVDRMFSMRNKQAVSLCDSFEYEKAMALSKDTVEAYQMVMEVQELFHVREEKSLDYAKNLSQLGQCYAFLEDQRAEKSFLEALSCMDKGTADYAITQSYLLHYYAERNDREKYEAYATEYFGNETSLEKQMMYIARLSANAVSSMRFAAYVFLKGVYHFYAETLTAKQAGMIYRWESTMKEMEKKTAGKWKGHPMLLINKYIALIATKRHKESVANEYLEKIRKSDETGILAVIRNHAILTIRKLQGMLSEEDEALCRETIHEMYNLSPERMAEVIGEEVSLSAIDKVVTYMYR